MATWAVIAHYGPSETTWATVAAILDGESRPERTLVIDNQGGLSDHPDPTVEVLRPGENIGFAAACGLGAARALAAGAGFVWVVNNDARPAVDCLYELERTAAAMPRAGLLSPLIVRGDGAGAWYAGGSVSPRALKVRHAFQPASAEPHDVGFVTGCAWLASAEFIRAAGMPEERLFMYFEDVDWSLRAQALGWRTVLVPAARVVHDVRYSARGRRLFSPFAVYFMTRNRLLLARRWGSPVAAFPLAVDWGLRQVVKSENRSMAAKTALAVAAGLLHGVARRDGPLGSRLAEVLR